MPNSELNTTDTDFSELWINPETGKPLFVFTDAVVVYSSPEPGQGMLGDALPAVRQ